MPSTQDFRHGFFAQAAVAASLLLGYGALALLLLRTVFFTGSASLIADPDGVWQTHAWLSHAWRAWQAGELPLWDFSSQSGISFIGELQTAPLYPPLILFAAWATPGEIVWSQAYVAFHFVLAAVFMHLLLRQLRLAVSACVVGAIAFAFLGAVAWRATAQPNLHASLVWLPLVVLLARNALAATERRALAAWSLGAGLALGQMILAGHVHGYVHAVIALGLLTALRPPRSWRPAFARLAAIGGVSLLTALGQLLATREYLRLAYKWHAGGPSTWPHRVPVDIYFDTGIDLPELRSLIDPSVAFASVDGGTLFSGYLALALALLAVVALSRRALSSEIRHWTVFALGLALVALALALADEGPLARLVHALPLVGEVRQASRALHLFAFALALLAALGAHGLLASGSAWPRWRAGIALLLVLISAAEADRELSRRLPGSVGGVRVAAAYHGPLVDQLEALSRQSRHLYRYLSEPRDWYSANLGNVRDLRHAQGYRSSMTRAYFDYLARDWSLPGPTWDALGVRWLLTDRAMSEFELIAQDGELRLYERPNVPTVFWTPTPGGGRRSVAIAQVDWHTNHVVVELAEPIGGPLVFAQTPFPDWQVNVDGVRRRLDEFDGLMAVELRPNDRRVEFRYAPTALRIAALAPLLLLGLLAGLAFTRRRRPLPAA